MTYPRAALITLFALIIAISQVAFGNLIQIGGVASSLVQTLALVLIFLDREDDGLLLLFVGGLFLEFFSPVRFGSLLFPWLLVFGLTTLLRRRYLLDVSRLVAGLYLGLAAVAANIPVLFVTQTGSFWFMMFFVNGLFGLMLFAFGRRLVPKRVGVLAR